VVVNWKCFKRRNKKGNTEAEEGYIAPAYVGEYNICWLTQHAGGAGELAETSSLIFVRNTLSL